MESRKNSYYLRNFDDFSIGKGNGISNTSGTKTGRSSQSRAMDFNPVEPNPSTPPVRKTPPIDKDTNPVEPNPSTHPVKNIKPVDTDMNPIEPNPKDNIPIQNDSNNTAPAPVDSAPRPAPSESAPVNEGTNQNDSSNTADETPSPSNSGDSSGGNTGNGNNHYDDHDYDDSWYDKYDDDDDYSGNGISSGSSNSGENQAPPAAGNTGNNGNTGNQTTPLPENTKSSADPDTGNKRNKDILSPRERGKAALLAKMDTDFASQVESSWLNGKAVAVDKQLNDYSSPIIAIDVNGRYIEMNNFNVDGMNISIKREHDGYGNKFDSVRSIDTVRLANGQVVKCNIKDMVGANAESKAFADKHSGMTLPDGKYFFTAEGLIKQADGTYNSIKFANTLRYQTDDPNIPQKIRHDINKKYYLPHATEYKPGYIPKEGNRIWINPWSAGCTSSKSGGQPVHDEFMNMLLGITPENIHTTITSKRHVDI
ncbi:hypothetical protein E4O00_05945 [Treponema sp. OMZ 788]|uniref:hypothetical protein n=1 Tax=Treponema sp. OMZ 788 TaxID=2563664 RepID=UPI0020A573DD|nr:hypothetical protein [Treponema sp. OMZ 788]UTC65627.1 hypothetical protein E4O00_05945 [Treponema sp. OMZ 788]